MRRAYQTDLSDTECSYIEPHVPAPPKASGGRPRVHHAPRREILDAVFHVLRGGCAWRLLPHDFAPWKTVYHYYFRIWRLEGTWVLKAKVHAANVFERDGIKLLLEGACEQFPRLRHPWLDAGYNGKDKGKDWVQKALGLAAEIVRHPPKPRSTCGRRKGKSPTGTN